MHSINRDLPFIEFTASQAADFHFRWDKLRSQLLQRNIISKLISDIELEILTAAGVFSSRVKKITTVTFFINALSIFRNLSEGRPIFYADFESFSIFIFSILIFGLALVIVKQDWPFSKELFISQMKLELQRLRGDWLVMSGGIDWTLYQSEDPMRLHGPDGDPNFINLKTAIAQCCVRHGDFQIDPDMGVVSWVRT